MIYFSSQGVIKMLTWIWVAVIILAVIIELSGPQLVSVWFAFGGAAALISLFLGAGLSLQIVLFVIVSAVALILTRPAAAKFSKGEKTPTNADRYIGMEGIVTDEINDIPASGRVMVKGSSWAAVCHEKGRIIEPGTKVIVKGIEGVRLVVEPAVPENHRNLKEI